MADAAGSSFSRARAKIAWARTLELFRIAGIEAPQLYGAACPKEVALGRQSAAKLQMLLNSGEIETTRVSQDLDRYGLLLRSVSVNGKDVGRAMMDAGVARGIGDLTRSWC